MGVYAGALESSSKQAFEQMSNIQQPLTGLHIDRELTGSSR